jgi:hypothetical protein
MTKALAPKARIISRRNTSLKVQAFTVTLKTPDGEQKVECDSETYILDAAEVRPESSPWPGRADLLAYVLLSSTCARVVQYILGYR